MSILEDDMYISWAMARAQLGWKEWVAAGGCVVSDCLVVKPSHA
jgi:hypothetical protein